MQRAEGLIRFGLTEELSPPFNTLAPTRFEVEGSFRYYLPSPFYGRPLAQYFGAGPTLVGPPAEFLAIFGPRPTDPLRRVTAGYWDQLLAQWRDNKRPDWVDDSAEQVAVLTAQQFKLGRLMPYRLNGSDWVFFPEADQRAAFDEIPGFVLGADMVYRHFAFGIAAYQSRLRNAGVVIPDDELIFILKRSGGHAI